ncbi:MAG TPA: bifunctional enoyl-CoA hydratase/phosphate acetyltransferase [Bacillota bacterium]|jgi:phosphate butyryltransferase|nr:bifunctional enoyl-CoA hydratase/phosphate acetyltransferase [Bacillota bacterium]HRS20507.1 bifunctional enoyl-CoA hydratase/phosphate acetyltransferase [Clostridia bacterium]HRU41031.1 bifunctional enoyl-CoA hydratase/phosphate acetyltransferase [Candidatus Diapherotrites archaeon]HQE66973.1 bifunctional enoyl-CoA hydratase/phosphate acetyltransferase [Bacillota bacterium]HQI17234.1 bifunctional enoyl-CoA hydratase/phosphate acetyltransferase [Bacillota bacterium]
MIKNFNELLETAKSQKKMKIVVAAAQDEDVIKAVSQAKEAGIAEPVLVGDKAKILEIMNELGIADSEFEIIDEPDLIQAARKSVELVKSGKGNFLMKGMIQTADIMRAVLDKEIGLRTENLISHIMVYEVPTYNKLLYTTDGGMNVAPNLEQKVQILENAIMVCKAMKMDRIYASCLAGAETVNPKIPATVDAKAIADMKDKWEAMGVFVQGPVALDLAISTEACEHKGFKSEGAGIADIVLAPYYEVGNVLGKSLTYFAGAKSAGIVMGAKVPIILTSRADSAETKLLSIALGSVVANN